MPGSFEFLHLRFLTESMRGYVLLDSDHDMVAVLASYLLAVLAAIASLQLLFLVRLERMSRLLLAGLCLGGGLWASLCTGILALRLPVPFAMDYGQLLNALIISVAGSFLALATTRPDGHGPARGHSLSVGRMLAGGTILGLSVVAMHHLGVHSIQWPAERVYLPDLWAYSILIAVTASTAALVATQYAAEGTSLTARPAKLFAAFAFALAICGTHYTGMAAQILYVEEMPVLATPAPGVDMLLLRIIATGIVLTCGLSFLLGSVRSRRTAESTMALVTGGMLFRLDQLMESIPDSVLVVARSGAVQQMNRSATELFDIDPASISSLNAATLISELNACIDDEQIQLHPQRYIEVVGMTTVGREVPLELSVAELEGSDGQLFVLVVRDISVRKRVEQHMRKLLEENKRLATTDTLTGLPNRRHILDTIGKEVSRCMRHGHALSVLMIDIDHFKQINDSYGHAVGDQALREMAEIVRSVARSSDLVSRFGGEEFLLALTETGVVQARLVAERLREQVSETSLMTERGERFSMTISVGIAQWEPGSLFEDIVALADKALYHAKESGRNRVVVYGPELEKSALMSGST